MLLINAGPSRRGWHRLEAAARCETLFGWGYGQAGSRPESANVFPPTGPLVRGSLGHVGLAHCYARTQWIQAGNDPTACPYYPPLDAMRLAAEPFGELGERMLPVAQRAVRAYANHYGAEPFRVVEVEREVEVDFEGHPYTARLDLVIEDTARKVWVFDHKFISRIEGKVFRRYVLSGQFLGFQWIGRRLWGEAFGGVRLNLIGCNVPGFARETPEPAPWMLERFPRVVAELERKIARVQELQARGEPLPASPSEHTCWGSYGECPAFDLCRWGPGHPIFSFTSDDEITPGIAP